MKPYILLVFLIPSICSGQGSNVGIGTTTPDNSAILDISSTDRGVLVPRLNSLQRLNIPNPADGLLVYDFDEDCFFFYQSSSSSWQSLCSSDGATGVTGATGEAGPIGPTGPGGGPPGPTGPTGPIGIPAPQIFSLTGEETVISDIFPDFGQITGLDTTITLTDSATVALFFTGNFKPVHGSVFQRGVVRMFLNGDPIPFTTEATSVLSAIETPWSVAKTLEQAPGTYHFQLMASKSMVYNSTINDIIACPCYSDTLNLIDCNNRHCNWMFQVFYR